MREKPNWLDRQLGVWRFDRVKSVYYCGGSQTDFSMLANLNYLEDFSNYECHEIDYSPLLKHAHSIRGIHLDPFPKNPEAFFAKFPNLEHISIARYVDLSRLKHLTKLKSVRFWARADAEFEHLSAFKELEFADLSCTTIKSTRSLANLKHLETLILDACEQLEDVVGVEQLPALKQLSLDSCKKIRDLSPVAECENLESFAFSPYGDPKHIFGLKKLKMIYDVLGFIQPDNISVLANFPSLERLNLNWSRMKTFDGVELDLKLLGSKQKLEYLAVCRITDSDDLARFPELEKLVVYDSLVKNSKSISSLGKLKMLVFHNCEFSDTVLQELQSQQFPEGFKFSRRTPAAAK